MDSELFFNCKDLSGSKFVVEFSSKTRFKEFFQLRAICSQNRKDSKLCSYLLMRKACPFLICCTIIIQQNFYFFSNHFSYTRGKIEKFNLAENLQNAQKCRHFIQKTNTCSETRIPMLLLYRSKYSHRESQHNSIKFFNRFRSFDITKKAIFHLFL